MYRFGNADPEKTENGKCWDVYKRIFDDISDKNADFSFFPDAGSYFEQDFLLMKRLSFVRNIVKKVIGEINNPKKE